MTLRALKAVAFVALLVVASWNLTSWPLTWFDEGSHLMVPKSVVRNGVYADYDSSGYRYFGATLGVGPTVLLPIAGAFEAFGVGLPQARAVMAAYLVLAVLAFYALARRVTGETAALLAAALLVVSPGIGTLEFGRQVLGEVPALLFLSLGLGLLASPAASARPWRLVLAGVLLGLAAITKYQLLGVMLLGLGVAWLLSLRAAGSWLVTFLVPAVVAGATFAVWQVVLLGYLGPSSFADNFRYVREAASGAALTLSASKTMAAGRLTLEPGMLLGALIPSLGYGAALAMRDDERSHGWRVVMGVAVAALLWFVIASIGWRRYVYPGVALACIPAAGLLVEGLASSSVKALRWTAACWVTAMLLGPLPVIVPRIAAPAPPHAQLMAEALRRDVAPGALVACWEPEMTFLTDHQYRVPPQSLLPVAVAHVWAGGPSPASRYDFMANGPPDYVLVGPFGRGVGLFPENRLRADFEFVESHGPYALFRRKHGAN